MKNPAWAVRPTDEDDTYEFRNVMRRAAGQVRIRRVNDGEPIIVPGPVGDDTAFEQTLEPGRYEISWHRMINRPEDRVNAEFELPTAELMRIDDPDD